MEQDLNFLGDFFPSTSAMRDEEDIFDVHSDAMEDQAQFWDEVMNQDTSLLDSIIADIENGKNYDPKAEAENNANSLMDDIESIKDLINIYPNTNVEQNKECKYEQMVCDTDEGILSDDSGVDYCQLVSPHSVSNSEFDQIPTSPDSIASSDPVQEKTSVSLSTLTSSSLVPSFIKTVFNNGRKAIIVPVVSLKPGDTRRPVTIKIVKKRKLSDSSDSSARTSLSTDTSSVSGSPSIKNKYPALILTDEEKRVCERDKIKFPSHYPLTREEEKNLKKIRRKIRNKASAQDSRRRKREYMTDMEKRMEQSSQETEALKQKLQSLETQNKTLAGQLRRLQQYIVNNGLKQNQPSTAMLVLLLSTALFLMTGQVEQHEGVKAVSHDVDVFHALKMPPLPGQSRSLLQMREDYDERIGENPTAGVSNKVAGEIKSMLPPSDILLDKQHQKLQLLDHNYSSVERKFLPDFFGPKRPKRSYIVEDEPPEGYGFADEKNETKYQIGLKDNFEMDGLDFMNGQEKALPEAKDLFHEKKAQFQKMSVDVASSGGIRTVVLHVPTDIM